MRKRTRTRTHTRMHTTQAMQQEVAEYILRSQVIKLSSSASMHRRNGQSHRGGGGGGVGVAEVMARVFAGRGPGDTVTAVDLQAMVS